MAHFSHIRTRSVRGTTIAILFALASTGLLLAVTASASAGAASHAKAGVHYPRRYLLTTAKIGHWAVVVKDVSAHAQPNLSSHVVGRLSTVTSDATQNIVLVLDGVDMSAGKTWYHVRLPILPNNSTGWVPRSSLGNIYAVHTHLYVDRETQRATLKKDGRTIFTTRVGVGKSVWPTPAGQFYIRDKLTNFNNPFYGPIAFGTSARSAVLTDWPGGGFVGVHGTNEPQLIPGYISHGCIRLSNDAIVKLAKLMPVGTPLTVT
jgi:lipoprotein-anchoring transpeptidase ErfK/SrfK